MSAPSGEDTLRAERACERLVIRYAHLIDLGDAAAVADLFTEDAVWQGPSRRWAGRERIRRGFASRERMVRRVSRHVCSPILITVSGEREAAGLTYVMLFGADDDWLHDEDAALPVDRFSVGEYHDRFRLDGDEWRFTARRSYVRLAGFRP